MSTPTFVPTLTARTAGRADKNTNVNNKLNLYFMFNKPPFNFFNITKIVMSLGEDSFRTI